MSDEFSFDVNNDNQRLHQNIIVIEDDPGQSQNIQYCYMPAAGKCDEYIAFHSSKYNDGVSKSFVYDKQKKIFVPKGEMLSHIYMYDGKTSLNSGSKLYYANIPDLDVALLDVAKDYTIMQQYPLGFANNRVAFHGDRALQYEKYTQISGQLSLVGIFFTVVFAFTAGLPAFIIAGSTAAVLGVLAHDFNQSSNAHLVKKLMWQTRQENAYHFEKQYLKLHEYSSVDTQHAGGGSIVKKEFNKDEYAKLYTLLRSALEHPGERVFISPKSLSNRYQSSKKQVFMMEKKSGYTVEY